MIGPAPSWPELSDPDARQTYTTLQLWTQIVGKIRLACTPWLNHSCHVTLDVTPRGLTTSPMAYAGGSFAIDFDFIDRHLAIGTSQGSERRLPLTDGTVANFYRSVLDSLAELGIKVRIDPMPNEMADPIPFPDDRTERRYDAHAALRFFLALVAVDRVLKRYRTSFVGKSSPVHFFWGSFDLAVTRFSGRRAPRHPGGVPHLPDSVVREAYSHEVISAGFWPGGDAFQEAAFYAYAYPEPQAYAAASVQPAAAFYHQGLHEFILPYEAVRGAISPEDALLAFLQSTYEAAATLGAWDRAALECEMGTIGRPHPV